MSIPYRDRSVDAVVTDPPYYDMIEYADASDLFHVWLKRVLLDIEPDPFGPRGRADQGWLAEQERRDHGPPGTRARAENAAFPLVPSSEDIRRAIFQTLSGSDPYEVVDGNGEAVAIPSPRSMPGFGIPGQTGPRAVVQVRVP